jgi:hypothetical protein
MKIFDIISEDISPRELDYIDQVADSIWKNLGIDVEFTRHFLDRVNHERNGEPITAEELIDLFKKEYQQNGQQIRDMKQADAILVDLMSNINIPFVLKKTGKKTKELVPTTVMRKQDFKSDPRQRRFKVKESDYQNLVPIPQQTASLLYGLEYNKKLLLKDYINRYLSTQELIKSNQKLISNLDPIIQKIFTDIIKLSPNQLQSVMSIIEPSSFEKHQERKNLNKLKRQADILKRQVDIE